MPKYKYQAKNPQGRKIGGSIIAQNEEHAVGELRKQNLVVLSIKEEGGGGGMGLFGKAQKRAPKPRIKLDDLVVFTRQLATMVSAGIPLLEALEILQDQAEDKGFKFVLGSIVDDVRSGNDLSNAMGRHPRVFKKIYVNMVRAGEASGQLDDILNRLAQYQEASAALRREIVSAMTYPVISLCLVMGITAFLLIGIVPKFKEIFESIQDKNGNPIELPAITKFFLWLSAFLVGNIFFILGGMVVAVIAFLIYKKTDRGEYQIDWVKLQIPIFGTLFRKVAISRFARTFATLIQSGVPILGALEIVSSTAGNRVISDVVDNARENVRQGESIGDPLAKSKVFPPMVVRMIAIGEKSGALEKLLEKIADFYDQQVKATIESLTSLIEPMMIGLMGGLVGSMVLAIFLPILKIQSSLAG